MGYIGGPKADCSWVAVRHGFLTAFLALADRASLLHLPGVVGLGLQPAHDEVAKSCIGLIAQHAIEQRGRGAAGQLQAILGTEALGHLEAEGAQGLGGTGQVEQIGRELDKIRADIEESRGAADAA